MNDELPRGYQQRFKLLIVTIYGSPHSLVEEFTSREQADFAHDKINSLGIYTKATKLYPEENK